MHRIRAAGKGGLLMGVPGLNSHSPLAAQDGHASALSTQTSTAALARLLMLASVKPQTSQLFLHLRWA